MVLVDTSVWVSYLRDGDSHLETLLNDGDVVCHPFIIGELACGNIKNRTEILSLLGSLPVVQIADHEEILTFIESKRLMRKGLGYIDIHLLASSILSDVSFWTCDKKLKEMAIELGINFKVK